MGERWGPVVRWGRAVVAVTVTGAVAGFGVAVGGWPSAAASAAPVAVAASTGCAVSSSGTMSSSGTTSSSGTMSSSGTTGSSGTTPPLVPFSAGGDTGSYLIAVPPGGSRSHPWPLVLDLHGYLETAQLQDAISGLSAYGTAHGFITVTPQVQYAVPHWDFLPSSADTAFIGALITHVETTECVDLHRVYVTGYSNGAFMTSWLVCTMANRLAAVAPVAGIQAPPSCHPSRPVPVIAFHGTADPFVPYGGGIGPKAKLLPAPNGQGTLGSELDSKAFAGISPATTAIPVVEARWAHRNGCTGPPTRTAAATGVTLIAYHCPSDATVELYRENGDGHIWAGSPFMRDISVAVGPTTFAIDDDQLMWAFFLAHPLPAR